MILEVSSRSRNTRRRRHKTIDLFCLLAVFAGDLSSSVKSEALPGAPIRRSVSVSTSVVSSLRVVPLVGQVVSVQHDTSQQHVQPQPQPQQTLPEISKIRDYSHVTPALNEFVQEQRLRRHWQQQQQQQLMPFQLLQARRGGADVQPVPQSASAGELSATSQPQHRHMSRALEAGGGGGARAAAEAPSSQVTKATGEQKGLKSMLRGVKKLVSSSFSSIEQRAGSILWLSSNLLAALIPLASLLGLPTFASTSASQAAHASNQTRRSSLAERVTSSLASLADGQQLVSALTAGGNGAGIQSRVEYVMGWLERSVEHLPNFPRLHPQECVKRSICEAHHEPNKYGVVGLTLRLLFPASTDTMNGTQAVSPMDNMEYKVINKYRHAAGYGLSRRLDNNSAGEPVCKEKYDDCLVSLLEVGQKLIDFFLR